MKKHRGEVIHKIVLDSKIPITKIEKDSGVSRSTIYKVFGEPEPRLDHIINIGRAISHDFSKEFPELLNFDLVHAREENLNFKLKYMELAEKYILVMEEREHYRKLAEKAKGK